MLKPRMEASSTGIRKIESAEQLWQVIQTLGDEASHYLLEKYLPGEVGPRTSSTSRAAKTAKRTSSRRVRALLDDYTRRFGEEFLSVVPHYTLPQRR